MQSRKKRILMCNDAHFLHTGFSKYGREVLGRLYDTDKYHIAELACFGRVNDERASGGWRYYANQPATDSYEYETYKNSPTNEFGSWRFDAVCLDFKPDIVFDIRDPWMLAFEAESPCRPFYHWSIMPTVDSNPQKVDWIDMFSKADSVFTYSKYGKRVLESESAGNIQVLDVAPPGCDIEVFKPMSKDKVRDSLGINKDINLLGTIMRNQNRKLYPDLFRAFRKFIDICKEKGNSDLAERTFLYVHTSYPDVGWEIPKLLKETELGRKVLFTYICRRCKNVQCNFFRGARYTCNACGYTDATLPNTSLGLEEADLARVINSFDAYIQYAVCEGFGMPQVEATSCGVPVMTVNYSAMEDIIENCGAISLPVQRMFRDGGTMAWRALPNNDKSAEAMYDFFMKPVEMRSIMGRKARLATEELYNWDRTAKIWENHFDSIPIVDKWGIPERVFDPIPEFIPEEILQGTPSQFINWLLRFVLQEPSKINSRYALQLINDLNFGAVKSGGNLQPFTKEHALKSITQKAKNKFTVEKVRSGKAEATSSDFIEFAHQREKYS